jgi:hypothetical protein
VRCGRANQTAARWKIGGLAYHDFTSNPLER